MNFPKSMVSKFCSLASPPPKDKIFYHKCFYIKDCKQFEILFFGNMSPHSNYCLSSKENFHQFSIFWIIKKILLPINAKLILGYLLPIASKIWKENCVHVVAHYIPIDGNVLT